MQMKTTPSGTTEMARSPISTSQTAMTSSKHQAAGQSPRPGSPQPTRAMRACYSDPAASEDAGRGAILCQERAWPAPGGTEGGGGFEEMTMINLKRFGIHGDDFVGERQPLVGGIGDLGLDAARGSSVFTISDEFFAGQSRSRFAPKRTLIRADEKSHRATLSGLNGFRPTPGGGWQSPPAGLSFRQFAGVSQGQMPDWRRAEGSGPSVYIRR